MIKLFSLELKNDDPLALASEVRSILHDIKNTGVEFDIPLIAYVKALYPTYAHYLESLQASGNLMKITFDSLEKKLQKERRLLERRQPLCLLKKLYVSHLERRIMLKILPEEEVAEEEEEISEEGGADKIKVKILILIAYAAIEIRIMHLHVSCLGI